MTDIATTNQHRARALERLGYTKREADFLCLAALTSGFFLRRQYVKFTDKTVGGTAAMLIEKLAAKGHARATTYAGGTHIYHLCARPFYAAIGEEDNRNRRMHQPASIKAKLMALDFVLSHPQGEYLTTEREKLDYFRGGLGVDLAALPSVRYIIRGKVAERYFVEKFPIFLAATSNAKKPKMPAFCYIDEGAAGLAGFETFLRRYGPLLSVLSDFMLMYVAATEMHFEGAANAFDRHFRPKQEGLGAAPDDALSISLLRYFSARQLADASLWDSFDRTKAVQYRKDKDDFAGSKYDALYDRWLREGDGAVRAALSPKPSIDLPVNGTFSTHLLTENYELFSSVAA